MTRSIATHGVAEAQLWTPKLLSNLKIWLDADDESTITYSSGSIVSQWNDKSGNANHASNSSASYRPSRTSNAQNGRAALDFTSNKYFRNTISSSVTGSAVTTYLVTKPTANWATTAYIIGVGPNTSTNNAASSDSIIMLVRNGSNSQVATYWNFSGFTASTTVTVDAWQVVGSRINVTASEVRVNGGTAGTGSWPGTPSLSGSVLAIATSTNQADNATDKYNSLIGEIVVVQAALDTADRQKLEGYLAWRWGLQGNLPSTHPYKNYRP